MKIEIWSDIMCPFCYIGKRRLESALAEFEFKDEVEIEWKSFLLNPDMKTDPSKSTLQYLSETKGWTMEQTQEMTSQVVAMAKVEDLDFKMDQTVVANAKKAHRVLQFAKSQNQGDAMKERFLKAYFIEGANIDDDTTLLNLGEEVGLTKSDLEENLYAKALDEKVERDIYESKLLGVRGVPFFVLDRKYGISGAQSIEVFTETLEKAWKDKEAV